MTRIRTEELSQKLESGQAAVFDARGDVEFERAHIPGAMTAPLGSLVFRVARVMHPDSFVTVYSAGKDCELAARAAQRLENLGLQNVHRYEHGLEGWRAANGTRSGSPSAIRFRQLAGASDHSVSQIYATL